VVKNPAKYPKNEAKLINSLLYLSPLSLVFIHTPERVPRNCPNLCQVRAKTGRQNLRIDPAS